MLGIFINRTINFKRIKYFGFDMDHTLVRYHSAEFERLVHELVVEKLISVKKYPEEIRKIPFEYDRIIRGLVIDKNRGNILKLNIHGYIRASYHGTAAIEYREQKRIYKGRHLDLGDPNFISVDTSFSISYGNLFAHLVDLKDKNVNLYPNYEDLSKDILDCVDEVHRDGSLKAVVCQNLDKYIIKDAELVKNLEKYKKAGKKLFVLTNSEFYYAKLLLDYAINPYLEESTSWQDLFEYVIAFASKPRFFYDRLPFLKVNTKDGSMQNITTKLEPGVYQGGCADFFTTDLGLSGDDILYFGDHIYGDIVRLKKDCAWRTALVIEELEAEVNKIKKAESISLKIQSFMTEKAPIEQEILFLEDEDILSGKKQHTDKIDSLYQKITAIDKQISEYIRAYNDVFNPYWGEVMRCGNEESYFAGQVARYACVYTSTLTELLRSSPRSYFRSYRRFMPHEINNSNK